MEVPSIRPSQPEPKCRLGNSTENPAMFYYPIRSNVGADNGIQLMIVHQGPVALTEICLTALLERGWVALVTWVKISQLRPSEKGFGADHQANPGTRWERTAPKEKFMRIMAFVLASALAVCFMDPASAASRRSGQSANPDRGPYPVSAGCGGVSCYRSGAQKIQKHKKH
jgi:hypothetical protein